MEHFGKPVQMRRYQLHERFGSAAHIPVKKIGSKYVYVPTKIRGSDVTIALPRDRAYNVQRLPRLKMITFGNVVSQA